MKQVLLHLLLWSVVLVQAQNLPAFKLVEGNTATLGGGYQFAVKEYYMVLLGNDPLYARLNQNQTTIGEVPDQNNPERRVTVSRFFISETEVTNAQYREFLLDSLFRPDEKKAFKAQLKAKQYDDVHHAWHPLITNAAMAGLLPDTNCWMTDFVLSSNEPLVKHYFLHPAFDQYPVVGVSWDQAKAYCAWLTWDMNQLRAARNLRPLPSYRLPTEMEWEFAAREFESKADKTVFAYNLPWKSTTMVDEKGQYRANIKTAPGVYIGDNYEYTAPAKSFAPNSKGLYQMAGNVAEWCEDVFRVNLVEEVKTEQAPRQIRLFEAADGGIPDEARVVKGGSWADFQYAALCGSRMGWPQARGGARIGFRVAMSQIGCDCKRTQKCTHIQEF